MLDVTQEETRMVLLALEEALHELYECNSENMGTLKLIEKAKRIMEYAKYFEE